MLDSTRCFRTISLSVFVNFSKVFCHARGSFFQKRWSGLLGRDLYGVPTTAFLFVCAVVSHVAVSSWSLKPKCPRREHLCRNLPSTWTSWCLHRSLRRRMSGVRRRRRETDEALRSLKWLGWGRGWLAFIKQIDRRLHLSYRSVHGIH